MTGQKGRRISRVKLWAGVLLLLACDGVKQQVKPPAPTAEVQAKPVEHVTVYDLHHNGHPDLWEYSVTGKDAAGKDVERLTRRELDLNGDGKPDVSTWFDEHGETTKEAIDHDFDGRVDQVNIWEHGQLARKELDFDGDGRPDVVESFEKGQKVRVERDTNHDGRIDTWEIYVGGKLDRTGEDTDGDGKPDRWTKNPDAVEGASP